MKIVFAGPLSNLRDERVWGGPGLVDRFEFVVSGL